MSLGFGTRARIGQLYPSGGLCDYELQLMAPEGVQIVTTRVPFRATGVADDLRLVADLERHAALLADAAVQLIAFNCTAASLLAGPDTIRRRIRRATGIPAITTIDAVAEGLRLVGARRIALLNPYPAEVEQHEVHYLAQRGFEVTATAGPACATPVEQGQVDPRDWVRIAGELDLTDVDTVLISCAGTRTADVIDEIEDVTDRPVVTSNQALLRLALASVGLPPVSPGHGRLLTPAPSPDRRYS